MQRDVEWKPADAGVEEDRALGVVALENFSRGCVDLDELVNISGVERAIMQGEPGRLVQALDPLPLEHLPVGG